MSSAAYKDEYIPIDTLKCVQSISYLRSNRLAIMLRTRTEKAKNAIGIPYKISSSYTYILVNIGTDATVNDIAKIPSHLKTSESLVLARIPLELYPLEILVSTS